jgi:PKD repeat protein
MHKIKTTICLFILIIIISSKQYAQTIVASPSVGCAPLVGVQFTGLVGASNPQWSFGDGTSSNLKNPTHTYSNIGNFTVTYSALVSGSNVTKTIVVTSLGKPTPSFSVNVAKGCVPLSVTFSDLSVNAGGTLTPKWQWSFGDGGVSSLQNPTYVYTIPGTFNVTLIYKNGYGCDSSLTKAGFITVSKKPTVVITSNPSNINACVLPFTAAFSGSLSTSNSTIGSS